MNAAAASKGIPWNYACQELVPWLRPGEMVPPPGLERALDPARVAEPHAGRGGHLADRGERYPGALRRGRYPRPCGGVDREQQLVVVARGDPKLGEERGLAGRERGPLPRR